MKANNHESRYHSLPRKNMGLEAWAASRSCHKTFLRLSIFLLGVGLGGNLGGATPGTVIWQFQTADVITAPLALGQDGTVYVGSWDHKLYALVGKNGAQKWSFAAGDRVTSSAVGADGTVYLGSWDRKLYALDGVTGALKWSFLTGHYIDACPAIGPDGTVYIGSWDRQFYALDGATGRQKWAFNAGAQVQSCGVIGGDGTVYFGAWNGKFFALESKTGALKWQFQTGSSISFLSPALGADGAVVFGSEDYQIYSLAGDTGSLRWKFPTGSKVFSSPVIGRDGTVYCGSQDRNVYALNGATGASQWVFRVGDLVESGPAIGADGTVYVGSHDNNLYALDGTTGVPKWKFRTGSWITSSPNIGADGTIYIGSMDGRVYALVGDAGGLTASPWPKFHGNAQNTGLGYLSKTDPAIFSQPIGGKGFPPGGTASDLSRTPKLIRAGAFSLTSSNTLGTVRWWGNSPGTSTALSFKALVFGDNAGAPLAMPLAESELSVTRTRISFDVPGKGTVAFDEYSGIFKTPIPLPAGKTFYFSVASTQPLDWSWATTWAPGSVWSGDSPNLDGPFHWGKQPYGVAFELFAAPTGNLPGGPVDEHTLLYLSFDSTLTGAQGEVPTVGRGITYETGMIGAGTRFPEGNDLRYDSTQNIAAQEGTLECWIQPDWSGGDAKNHAILAWGAAGGAVFIKDAANNLRSLFNRWSSEVGVVLNVGNWQPQLWHHVAFTWRSATQPTPQSVCNLYVDGKLASTSTFPYAISPPTAEPQVLQLGGELGAGNLQAVLDELRISDIARSADEIQASYQRPASLQPPTFFVQPQSQTHTAGETATFAVAVTTGATPGFEWRKDGIALAEGGRFAGTRTSSLVISDLQMSDAGAYSVWVTNAYGGALSQTAILTVLDTRPPPAVLWGVNGHHYQRVDAPGITWTAAKAAAEAATYGGLAGHLVTVTSAAENLFLTQTEGLGDGANDRLNRFWMGAYQPDGAPEPAGGWCWITSEPLAFQNWATGGVFSEPNNAYPGENVILFNHSFNNNGKMWNDAPDGYAASLGYVIEYDDLPVISGPPFPPYAIAAAIQTQPTNQTVNAGATVTFTVQATGSPPLGYLWYKEGKPLAGAGAATLVLANVQAGDAGRYVVAVSNAVSAVMSQPATLTVLSVPKPVVTIQTADQTVLEGASVTFSATVTASPPTTWTIQWQRNGTDLTGAVVPSLTLTNVQPRDAGRYRIRVSGNFGEVFSVEVLLTVMGHIRYVVEPVTVGPLAGSGVAGFADGIGATAEFNFPNGGYVDPAGNTYIADLGNHQIRKVSPQGEVTTLAGSGLAGFADGPAHAARFSYPLGITADPVGNVWVADTFNHRIRKLSPDGIVSTVAGSGAPGYRDGPGPVAQFDMPLDVVVGEAGTLYVCEFNNHTVRKITPDGTVSTWAGNGTPGAADGLRAEARFDRPAGIARDRAGNLYVSEWMGQRIRKISPEGQVSVLAGSGTPGYLDGPGSGAQFDSPAGIVVGADGALYVADFGNHVIRRVSAAGMVETVAGTGAAGYSDGAGAQAQFWWPSGIGTDGGGTIYVADWGNQRIRKITLNAAAPVLITRPHIEWQQTFGGSGQDQPGKSGGGSGGEPRDLQPTSDGGYVLGAITMSPPSGNKTSPAFGGPDYWILRFGGDGKLLWEKTLGGGALDWLRTVLATPDGGCVAGGDSDSTPSGNKSSPNYGNADYWIVRLDAAGNKLWDKSFGGSSSEEFRMIQPTADGGYVVGGSSASPVGGNKSSPNYGGADFWLVRLDANGNKLWDKSYGGTMADVLMMLRPTADGGFILGGFSMSSASGNKSSPNYGGYDYWLVRLDADGNKLWDQSFGGNQEDSELRALELIDDGGFILGGTSASPASGNKSSPNYGGSNYWIVRVDAAGNKLWDKSFGGSNYDFLRRLEPTTDGGFILGGISTSPASGNRSSPNIGNRDLWLVRLDSRGNILWDRAYGAEGGELLTGLKLMGDGGFLLGGSSASKKGHGAWDCWVVRLDANGALVWDEYFGGKDTDTLTSFELTPDGGILLVSDAWSGAKGDKTSPNFGVNDIWVVKLSSELATLTPGGAVRPQMPAGYAPGVPLTGIFPLPMEHAITLTREGTSLKITYTGTLQQADVITGPWRDVPNTPSLVIIEPVGAARFYRARD